MRVPAAFLFLAVVGLALVPSIGAQLPGPDPLDPPPPLEPIGPAPEPSTCPSATACAGETSSESADCDGDTTEWGRNKNATYLTVLDPLTYSAVIAYDQCATGNWWQEYRGLFIVHHNPALAVVAGGYTLEEGATDRTQYYALVFTPAGGVDARWTGEERETDPTCTASLSANVMGFRIWDDFPCPIPPPQVPEAEWGNILP